MATKRKKRTGRPVEKHLPPRIEATPEQIAQAVFAMPADHEWKYLNDGPPYYRCVECKREVHYPETLFKNGRCPDCKAKVG